MNGVLGGQYLTTRVAGLLTLLENVVINVWVGVVL